MIWLGRILTWACSLIALLFLLFVQEASGGHGGCLCEWSYDKDGAGMRVDGCG